LFKNIFTHTKQTRAKEKIAFPHKERISPIWKMHWWNSFNVCKPTLD